MCNTGVNAGVRTVEELLDRYIQAKQPSWRPRTLADAQATIQRYLIPHLGHLEVQHLSAAHIEPLLTRYHNRRRTALRIYRTLSAACRLAVRRRWMNHNPCEELDPPAYRPQPRRMWTLDELHRFLECTRDHPMYTLWLTAVCTGCRPGELFALSWADVSVDLCAIRVCKSVQKIRGQEVITPPKTPSGDRVIPIPRQLLELLLATQGGMAGRVFRHTHRHAQKELKRLCTRLGLPPITLHGFRHLHASLLLTRGMPIPEVSQRLGHAHPGITMGVYAHVLGQSYKAVQIMEDLLK